MSIEKRKEKKTEGADIRETGSGFKEEQEAGEATRYYPHPRGHVQMQNSTQEII
jgi:hypothetical protein